MIDKAHLAELLLKPMLPTERPLDESCTACGAKALVAVQAPAWGTWGGTVVCKACNAKETVMAHLGKQIFSVEPLEQPEESPQEAKELK